MRTLVALCSSGRYRARDGEAAAANVGSVLSGSRGRAGLERLLRPRVVAIVGASADVSRTAGKPLPYVRKRGFDGEIMVVNPRYPSIDGVTAYPSVSALPSVPDVALVLL